MVLKVLEDAFGSQHALENKLWLQDVRSLTEAEGIFQQIRELLEALTSKLKPVSGKKQVLQTLKWAMDKSGVDREIVKIGRLKQSVNLVLTQASLALSENTHDDVLGVKKIVVDQEAKVVVDWLSPLNFVARLDSVLNQRRGIYYTLQRKGTILLSRRC